VHGSTDSAAWVPGSGPVPSLLRRVAGNAVVLAHLPGQRAIPYAPRKRIETLRDERVARMVRFAARAVPHYRDLFRRLGIDPREIRTARDLVRLPLLDKDELRAAPERFVSETRAGRNALEFVSSGTSGKAARIWHDRRSLLGNIAWGERERAVTTALVGRRLGYREAGIGYPTGTIQKVRAFYAATTLLKRPSRLALSVLTPLADTVARLNEFRPDVISAFGNSLAAISRAVAGGELALVRPKVLIYSAESVTHDVRREIERTLGAPVISHYSAVEVFKLGFLCERREGFHLHEDLCHVRICDPDGRDLPPGEAGNVVISNLVNRGTVLLNYRLGDVASFAEQQCSCGRTLRMLADVDGRSEDMLELDHGRVLHPRAVWGVVKPWPEVVQYQLVQEQPRRFVLRLVTLAEDDYLRVAPAVARRLEELLGPGTHVATERHERLVEERSGKVRMVVALAPAPGRPVTT
jgi:phenylacetate-CoA ligase